MQDIKTKKRISRAKAALLAAGVLLAVVVGLLLAGGGDRIIEAKNGIAFSSRNMFRMHLDDLGSAGRIQERIPLPDEADGGPLQDFLESLTPDQRQAFVKLFTQERRATRRLLLKEGRDTTAESSANTDAFRGGQTPVTNSVMRPSRLSDASTMLICFLVTSGLVVTLMIYAGILLIRAGSTAGGAKIDFIGLKVDAKGGGIASIAVAAVVLVSTLRPLIDAVVTLSSKD